METIKEDFGTKWFHSMKNPQEKAFAEGEKLGHTFYCHIDMYNDTIQSKGFGSYKDIRTFWKATKNILPEEKAIYEIVREDKPIKLFADLEWDLTWKSETEIRDLIPTIFNEGLEELDYEINYENLKITSACREDTHKGSLHLVHPEVWFRNLNDQRRFWNNIKNKMTDRHADLFFDCPTDSNIINKTFIDFSVYTKNRAFRLVKSSKVVNGKFERPLIPDEPINSKNISDFIISAPPPEGALFIDVSPLPIDTSFLGKRNMLPRTKLAQIASLYNTDIGEIKGNLITLKNRGKVRKCPIGGEENKSDNAYLTINNCQLLYHCHDENCRHKSKVIHTIENEDLHDSVPFNEYSRLMYEAMESDKKIRERLLIKEDARRVVGTSTEGNKVEKRGRPRKEGNDDFQNLQPTKNKTHEIYLTILNDMNKYFCVIKGGSKPYFMTRQVAFDDLGIKYIKYIRQFKSGLVESHENHTFPNKGSKSFIWHWLHWGGRRSYTEEVFQSPTLECPSNLFNTFSGFNITKEMADLKGTQDVSHVVKFIREAWCGGNEAITDWVLNWFAHNLQKPLNKMLSAIVLRGEEGIGKGIVVQHLCKIMGPQHFSQPSSSEDVLGHFNGNIANKAFIFLDELVWGGDKQKAGILKKFITESKGTINEKFEPVRSFTNSFNLLMASNEDWVCPTGNNARRYLILDVHNNQTQEQKDAVRLTDPYSWAKFLYNRDISNFRHNEIIATTGLANQKELSAPDVIKYILDQVKAKEFPFGKRVLPRNLYDQYKSAYQQDKYTTIQTFGKHMKKVFTDLKKVRPKNKEFYIIPSEEECIYAINKFFHQDMFEEYTEEERKNTVYDPDETVPVDEDQERLERLIIE